jgi:hypothetical protein
VTPLEEREPVPHELLPIVPSTYPELVLQRKNKNVSMSKTYRSSFLQNWLFACKILKGKSAFFWSHAVGV